MEWNKIKEVLHIKSDWMDLYVEMWKKGNESIEYWRISKKDSLIVIGLQGGRLILPRPDFRVGVSEVTLDFAGGRVEDHSENGLKITALKIAHRELGLEKEYVKEIDLLDAKGKYVNSSFNDQKIYVALIHINEQVIINKECKVFGIKQLALLYEQLKCMQCAYALELFERNYNG